MILADIVEMERFLSSPHCLATQVGHSAFSCASPPAALTLTSKPLAFCLLIRLSQLVENILWWVSFTLSSSYWPIQLMSWMVGRFFYLVISLYIKGEVLVRSLRSLTIRPLSLNVSSVSLVASNFELLLSTELVNSATIRWISPHMNKSFYRWEQRHEPKERLLGAISLQVVTWWL